MEKIALILLILYSGLVSSCQVQSSISNESLERLVNNYDELHRLVVEEQINNYRQAEKSLETRVSKSLDDGIYDFCLDDRNEGFKNRWHSKDLRSECRVEENYYRFPVPSAFNDISSNKTVRNYIGWFWYQTTIEDHDRIFFNSLSTKMNDVYTFIQFENVNYLALVWVQPIGLFKNRTIDNNNSEATLIGSHVGGYLPFVNNITPFTRSMDNKPVVLRLTLAISNNLTQETIPSGQLIDYSEQTGIKGFYQFKPDFDFFHYAGILGSIKMFNLPKVYIKDVIQLRPSSNAVKPKFDIYPGDNNPMLVSEDKCEYLFELLLNHEVIHTQSHKNKGKGCDIASIEFDLKRQSVPEKRYIWSLANGRPNHFNPKLKARITLILNNVIEDVYEFKAGFRPTFRELYGGIQMQGFGTHHEQLFSGRSMNQASIMKDIYLIKQMGANVIRTSHYPYSSEFLDACSENGISIIAECQAVGLKTFTDTKLELHKQLLKEMMHRDNNNAAIVAWSIANEPQSQKKEARDYFSKLVDFIKDKLANYSTRSDKEITAAIAQSHGDDKVGDFLDFIMLNRYYGWYDYTGTIEAIRKALIESLSGWAQEHPHKPILISEFGSDTLAGYHSTSDELFSEEYQTNLVKCHESTFDDLYAKRPQELDNNTIDSTKRIKFFGSLVWNFADFDTHISLERFGGNKKGIFTKDRRPKSAAHELKKIYLLRIKERQSS